MRIAWIGLLLLALAACRDALGDAGTPDASRVATDTLVLAPGQEAWVSAAFHVVFLEVSADSRCPSDVVCVWAGDAAVEIGLAVGSGPTFPFTLHTVSNPQASVDFAGYRVTLLDLTPYPISTKPIQPDEYRAHLSVTTSPPTPLAGRR